MLFRHFVLSRRERGFDSSWDHQSGQGFFRIGQAAHTHNYTHMLQSRLNRRRISYLRSNCNPLNHHLASQWPPHFDQAAINCEIEDMKRRSADGLSSRKPCQRPGCANLGRLRRQNRNRTRRAIYLCSWCVESLPPFEISELFLQFGAGEDPPDSAQLTAAAQNSLAYSLTVAQSEPTSTLASRLGGSGPAEQIHF